MRQLERDMGGLRADCGLGSKAMLEFITVAELDAAPERAFGDGIQRFRTEMHTPNM